MTYPDDYDEEPRPRHRIGDVAAANPVLTVAALILLTWASPIVPRYGDFLAGLAWATVGIAVLVHLADEHRIRELEKIEEARRFEREVFGTDDGREPFRIIPSKPYDWQHEER